MSLLSRTSTLSDICDTVYMVFLVQSVTRTVLYYSQNFHKLYKTSCGSSLEQILVYVDRLRNSCKGILDQTVLKIPRIRSVFSEKSCLFFSSEKYIFLG